MKFLAVVVLALLAVSVRSDDGIMKIVMACKEQVGATDDDLAKIMSHAPAENKPQKCMFSCMMAAANVIKDGVLQNDGYTALATIVTGGDAGQMKIAENIFTECSKLGGAGDPCEVAAKIGDCITVMGKKDGIIFLG